MRQALRDPFIYALFTTLLFFTLKVNGQDTLKLKDGTVQLVKILEINESSIKYKKTEFLNGPSYLILISDVKTVIYQNGTKREFAAVKPTHFSSYEPNNTGEDLNAYRTSVELNPEVIKKPYKKSGPRIGCTYVGEGSAADWINDKGKVPFVTQLGWEFEGRFFTSESGIAGLVECNLLLAGMEQGMLLPNGSVLLGIRGPEGMEFALGPNLSLSGLGMEFTVGNTLQLGDVYFPVNLSFVPSVKQTEESYTGKKVYTQTGFRVSLLIGFYSKKK